MVFYRFKERVFSRYDFYFTFYSSWTLFASLISGLTLPYFCSVLILFLIVEIITGFLILLIYLDYNTALFNFNGMTGYWIQEPDR